MNSQCRFCLKSLISILAILSCNLLSRSAYGIDPTQARLSGHLDASVAKLNFSRDVIPALTKAGCNSGACHGSFQGRGGFQLSLLGFDAKFDHEMLTRASRGRRVSPTSPEQSLLLMKPTGGLAHGGGRRMTNDSEVATILRQWQAMGMPEPDEKDLTGLQIEVSPPFLLMPFSVADSTTSNRSDSKGTPLKVTARFGDGSTRDITPWALYDARDKTIAEVSSEGLVVAKRSGKTSISVKYLGQVASVGISIPYGPTTNFSFPSQNFLDDMAATEWKRLGVEPAPVCDDQTFIRRIYLDLIGTLPTVEETNEFLKDRSTDKRTRIVDALLSRNEYVDYWSLKWGDMLRAHRRYIGDKGLASFNNWIRLSIRDNKPLDVMARELLTARGNLFTNGPVAYFFIDEKPEDLAETTSQIFLGVRLQCTKCHHHPNEVWSQQDYFGLASFFTKLETKDSGAQGAKFGGPKLLRPTLVDNPNRKLAVASGSRLFGESIPNSEQTASADPREFLAEWVTRSTNPFFARNFVNRYWGAVFGIGFVEPIDDMRATNPASLPDLLDALAADFASNRFDVKHLLRVICTSRIYQLASELRPQRDIEGTLFTHRVPRRLPAEVLLDAINQVTGTTETFASQPPGTRAIALPDPTVSSLFLATFGKPARNSPCDCSRSSLPDLSQSLHLANSTAIHDKIVSPTGRLANMLKAGKSDEEILNYFYQAAFSRRPSSQEIVAVREALSEGGVRDEVWQDILWAIINCSEFSFGH